MRVERRIAVDAPVEAVWEFISEPDNYRRFMSDITRWDVESARRVGLGARYAMRMKVGSAEIGGLIEIVEFDEPYEIAWTGVTGIDQRGRWRLRERDDGGTDVTLRLGYHAEGGLFGLIAERVASLLLGRSLQRSLLELKRRLSEPG